MTMPDVIYLTLDDEDSYLWCKDQVRDDDIKYYSQSKVDELIEQAHMAGQFDAGVDPSYSNALAYRINLKIGDSDE